MHEAFWSICLLKDYPYSIECLACYDNYLLVGTRQGLLLIYEVTPKSVNHPAYFIPPITPRVVPIRKVTVRARGQIADSHDDSKQPTESSSSRSLAQLPSFSTRVHTTRTLGKKPILQLACVPELDLLLALTEGHMNVYQLQNFQLISTVPSSRGATAFAHCLILQKESLVASQGDSSADHNRGVDGSMDVDTGFLGSPLRNAAVISLRICVVVKCDLMLWQWNLVKQEFVPLGRSGDQITPNWLSTLTFIEPVRTLAFSGNNHLIVGVRSEYFLVSLTSGDTRSVGRPSRNHSPMTCSLFGCFRGENIQYPGSTAGPESSLCLEDSVTSSRRRFGSTRYQQTSADAVSIASSGSGCANGSVVAREARRERQEGQRWLWATSPAQLAILSQLHLQAIPSLLQPIAPAFGWTHDNALGVTADDEASRDLKNLAQVTWTSAPHLLHAYPPYLIAALPNSLEVRVLDPWELVQRLPIARVQAMCHQGGWFYAATAAAVANRSPVSRYSVGDPDHPSSDQRRQSTGSNPDRAKSPESSTAVDNGGIQVWLILSARRTELVESLIARKEFELALLLADVASWTGQAPIETHQIVKQYAFSLYSERQFSKSLQLFYDQGIDPSHVLSLFPDLIPEEISCRIRHPANLLSLTPNELSNALEPIVTYILTWRRLLLRKISTCTFVRFKSETGSTAVEVSCQSITDDSSTVQPASQLLEVVDTALLKCYLTTNAALVAPLLRQANSCNLAQSEKALLHYRRYQELIILYQSNGLHRKGLSLLLQLGLRRLGGHRSDSPERDSTRAASPVLDLDTNNVDEGEDSRLDELGHPRHMVDYLRALCPAHFDLVTDYAGWVCRHYPMAWMSILAAWERNMLLADSGGAGAGDAKSDDIPTRRAFHRRQVVKYLEEKASHLVVPYLEQLIFTPPSEFAYNDEDVDYVDQGTDGVGWAEGTGGTEPVGLSPDKSTKPDLSSSSPPVGKLTSRPTSPAVVTNCLWRLPHSGSAADPDQLPPIHSHSLKDVNVGEIHTRYAVALIAQVERLQSGSEQPFAVHVGMQQPAGGPVVRLRKRLLQFLGQQEARFSAAAVLARCPENGFLEERALLLAKLNRHEQALVLWVHVLDEWAIAVAHCLRVHQRCTAAPRRPALEDAASEEAFEKDVFVVLIKVCMQPPDPATLGLITTVSPGSRSEADAASLTCQSFTAKPERAVEVLQRFGDRVDATKVIRLLSSSRLFDVREFLKTTLLHQESLLIHLLFLCNAANSELSASRLSLVQASSGQFTLSQHEVCRTCRRQIGTSAFVRHPGTRDFEHYGCCRQLLSNYCNVRP